MNKKQYLTEDGKLDFNKLDLLTESQLLAEQRTWDDATMYQYITRGSAMSMEQFESSMFELFSEMENGDESQSNA